MPIDFALQPTRIVIAVLVRYLNALPRPLLSVVRAADGSKAGDDDALRELDALAAIDDDDVRSVLIGCFVHSCLDGASRHLLECVAAVARVVPARANSVRHRYLLRLQARLAALSTAASCAGGVPNRLSCR